MTDVGDSTSCYCSGCGQYVPAGMTPHSCPGYGGHYRTPTVTTIPADCLAERDQAIRVLRYVVVNNRADWAKERGTTWEKEERAAAALGPLSPEDQAYLAAIEKQTEPA